MNDLYGLEASGLPPEMIAQLTGNARRRAIAEAMLKQSMEMPQAAPVKGRFQGVVSPLEHVAKLVQSVMANRDIRSADEANATLAGQAESGRKAAMEAYMRRKMGVPGVAPATAVDDEGNAMPSSPGVPADPRGALAAGFADPYLAKSPFLRAEQGALDKAESREDQQAFLKSQSEAAAAERKARADADRAAALERDKVRADERRESRESNNALRREMMANRPQPQPQAITDAAGNVSFYLNGQKVGEAKGAGKPSATFEKVQAEKKKMAADLDSAIGELEDATKDGGLIDQSTGSGAGAMVDSVAGFFGKATPGAVAAGRMAPIFDKVLKMVPRFEGPQSDKDTQTYKEAAGQLANPAVPTPQKKAAAKEILRLMKSRKGQFVGSDAPPASTSVFDEADAIINGNR